MKLASWIYPFLSALRWGVLIWALALPSPPTFADGAPTSGSTGALTGTPAVVCSRLASADGSAALFGAQDREPVIAFYTARQCRPLWVDERGSNRAAKRAIAELAQAAAWGLNASDFKLVAVDQPFTSGRWSAEQMANAEFELTAAILRYAHQAQGGRVPQPDELLSSYLDRQPVISGASEVLAQISEADDPGEMLRSYQPAQDQFLKLKGLLAELKGKSRPTEEFKISRHGPTLQLVSRNTEVAVLKKRFAVAPEAGAEQVFDQPLVDAVKKFQMSNSLVSDGIIGPGTRAALAGDAADKNSEKITAVLANMEEWRWMPRSLGATHILVNIPSFSIVLTDKNQTVFEERVVVGAPSTQTPIFSKDMTTIVLRPEWNLPDSIKLTALLSGRSIEGQGYVVKRNGHTVDSSRVNWTKANLSEYTIYQPSGDDNALGLVKLLFPNKHSVYLHDTPSKSLFIESVRLFSHGCIRVRNPQQLAQHIFDIDRGDAAPIVNRLVRKGPMNNEFMLNTPIPVHVGYFTVWVDADGEAKYFRDYYGHQQRITLALAGKWDQIDVGRDHLAPVDASLLKAVHIGSKSRSKKAARIANSIRRHDFGTVEHRQSGSFVGELIRKTLGGF